MVTPDRAASHVAWYYYDPPIESYSHLVLWMLAAGEVTWDTPANMQVPIAPLSPAREEELRKEAEE